MRPLSVAARWDLGVPSLGSLLSALAPPTCWACGQPARAGDPLCHACRAQLRWRVDEPPVLLAGIPVWAPVAYEGPARALVGGLKFRGAAGLAAPLAAQIAATAPRELLRPPAVLVPVPAHPRRRRSRGYDQAELLAAELGRRAGMGVARCLRRGGPATRQVGRGRAERLLAVEGTVRPRGRVPERALLVDDVVTTGGTLAACADVLHAAGAIDVAAVAYALTPGR